MCESDVDKQKHGANTFHGSIKESTAITTELRKSQSNCAHTEGPESQSTPSRDVSDSLCAPMKLRMELEDSLNLKGEAVLSF